MTKGYQRKRKKYGFQPLEILDLSEEGRTPKKKAYHTSLQIQVSTIGRQEHIIILFKIVFYILSIYIKGSKNILLNYILGTAANCRFDD